jgi:hypothetical protein
MSSNILNFPSDRLQKIENRFKNESFRVGLIPSLIDPSKEKETSKRELDVLSKMLDDLETRTGLSQPGLDESDYFLTYNRNCELVKNFIDSKKYVNLKI